VLLLAGLVFRDVRVDAPEFQPWIERVESLAAQATCSRL